MTGDALAVRPECERRWDCAALGETSWETLFAGAM